MSITRKIGVHDTWSYYGHLKLYNVNPGTQRLVHTAGDDQVIRFNRVSFETYRENDGVEYHGQMWTGSLVVVRKNSIGSQGLNTPLFAGVGFNLTAASSVGEHYSDTDSMIFSAAGISVGGWANPRVTWNNPREMLVKLNYQDTLWIVGGCYIAYDVDLVFDMEFDILH